MKKKSLIATVLLTTLVLGACGNVGADNGTTEKSVKSSQQTETTDSSEKTEVSESETTEESEKFVAQGKTTLMNFLSAASDNGYEITNPERGDIYITAIAKGSEDEYKVKYMVENQKVYSVSVYTDSVEEMSDESFQKCFYAMAKALNPELDEEAIKESTEGAVTTQDKEIIDADTLFKCDSKDMCLTVSY